ncbi:MAG: hypothetical protein HZB31_01165 [Nitrospirae bacterium]|nr:hypothetical protein [Nitrospirota bacterium]
MKKATVSRREGIKFFCLVMSVTCLIVGSSSSGIAKPSRSCDEDAAKFCKDVQRGGGQVVKCLQEHEKDVTPACKQEMAEMKSKMKGFKEFCGDEVQKYCKDIKPGEGRIIQCLKGHEDQLSSQCKSNLPPLR